MTHADAAGKDEQHRVVQSAVCCAAHGPCDTHRHRHTRRQLPRHLLHAQNLCACSWAHSMHGCTPKHSSDAVNTVGSRPPRRQHCMWVVLMLLCSQYARLHAEAQDGYVLRACCCLVKLVICKIHCSVGERELHSTTNLGEVPIVLHVEGDRVAGVARHLQLTVIDVCSC